MISSLRLVTVAMIGSLVFPAVSLAQGVAVQDEVHETQRRVARPSMPGYLSALVLFKLATRQIESAQRDLSLLIEGANFEGMTVGDQYSLLLLRASVGASASSYSASYKDLTRAGEVAPALRDWIYWRALAFTSTNLVVDGTQDVAIIATGAGAFEVLATEHPASMDRIARQSADFLLRALKNCHAFPDLQERLANALIALPPP